MPTVTIMEAQSKLSELIHKLNPDEEILITENNQLLPIRRSPMKTYAINNLTPSFEELIGEVRRGEEIVLTDQGQAVARIIPFRTLEAVDMAKPGLWKNLPGKFWMSADFDMPLDDFNEYME